MTRPQWILASTLALLCSPFLQAQTQAPAPAGSTGQCKDGTYTSAAKKEGACRGHKGVQTWLVAAAPAAASAPAAAPAPALKPAATPAPAPSAPTLPPAQTAVAAKPATRQSPAVAAAARTQAPGGGPGLVWVNTSTKVYHCSGSDFYGKTKDGKYMSEADAKTAGAHADHNKPCTK